MLSAVFKEHRFFVCPSPESLLFEGLTSALTHAVLTGSRRFPFGDRVNINLSLLGLPNFLPPFSTRLVLPIEKWIQAEVQSWIRISYFRQRHKSHATHYLTWTIPCIVYIGFVRIFPASPPAVNGIRLPYLHLLNVTQPFGVIYAKCFQFFFQLFPSIPPTSRFRCHFHIPARTLRLPCHTRFDDKHLHVTISVRTHIYIHTLGLGIAFLRVPILGSLTINSKVYDLTVTVTVTRRCIIPGDSRAHKGNLYMTTRRVYLRYRVLVRGQRIFRPGPRTRSFLEEAVGGCASRRHGGLIRGRYICTVFTPRRVIYM